MIDLINDTTATLVHNIPAAGQGLVHAVREAAQTQHLADTGLAALFSNPKAYAIMTTLIPIIVAIDRKLGISDALARLFNEIGRPKSAPPTPVIGQPDGKP